MTTREALLTVHVISSVIWIGGGVALNVLATRLATTNPELLPPIVKSFDWVVSRTIIPSSLLVLLFGVLLTLEGTYRFQDTFVIIGIIGGISTFVLGITVLSPRFKMLDKLWEEHGGESELALQALSRTLLIARIDVIMLLVIIGIMVTKPGR